MSNHTSNRGWTQTRSTGRDLHQAVFIEAVCPHGIGHHKGVHGCDGCCANAPKEIWDDVTNEESPKQEKCPQQADEWEKVFDQIALPYQDDAQSFFAYRQALLHFFRQAIKSEKEKAYKKGLEESQSSLLQSLADEVGQLDTGGSPCGGYSRGFYTAVIKASELILNRIKL